ncbi:MAG: sulfatase [Candidatus Hydrogenedentes bacterium]|nr:sulfatase [Candidatus Hydrogenedentota bacterium]
MNIILMVFDSLRKDCVGVYGSPPWGRVHTPNFDAFAKQSLVMTRAYPESLPTLPARRALYTGRRVYPFHNADYRLKGDFLGAPGWGPIPEEQPTLAELLREAGYRTGLIADLYHMFKPSKNYWRGFDQWTYLRGQESDPSRSGPRLTQAELDYWLPKQMQTEWATQFVERCILNMRDRVKEEDYFAPRVLKEAALWLEQNQDAERFFLTIESFDPHEPWLVPAHYRKMYMDEDGPEQVISGYKDTSKLDPKLMRRTQANYSGAVTQCDRWFGHLMETLRVLRLLENTMVFLFADHGHSIGDRNYLGKRGYPSSPEVYDVPLMVRFPGAKHAGNRSEMFVQHTDVTATVLQQAGVALPAELDGKPFLEEALAGRPGTRDHVTVGWGTTPTVISHHWWLNCKVDGTGVFLHDLRAADPYASNVATKNPDTVDDLFALAKADAVGGYPEYLLNIARKEADAPGCSDMAARM